jgi:membrane-bound ClpP family serine protease
MSHAVAAPAAHGGHGSQAPNSISIPWVLAASLIMGLGVFLISIWIVTFDFLYFVGFFVLVGGFLMTFDQRMGSDHA